MNKIDKIFFSFFLKKGKIELIKNNLIYRLFLKIFRPFLKGPFLIKIDGFQLLSFPQKDQPTYGVLKRLKFHETSEIKYLKKIIRNNDVIFIDAGSNYGHYSLLVAKENYKNKIFAFEPSSIIRKQFMENIKINNFSNINLESYAVTNTSGLINFYETEKSWENSILYEHLSNAKKTVVKSTSLDEYFNNFNFLEKKIIIKFDIEGSEINAFYGTKNIIKKYNPTIFFEFSKMFIKNSLFSENEFNSFLNEHNYSIYDLNLKKKKISELVYEVSKLKKNQQTIGNFLLMNLNINH